MEEVWKDIPGYEGLYQASDLGNVKSLDKEYYMKRNNCTAIRRGKTLNPFINAQGRRAVDLNKNGVSESLVVSQIIAITFLNHKRCGLDMVVDHIDNDCLNDKLSNLQILSNRENCSKDKKNKTSNFTGVHWDKSRLKWKASIRINKKEVFLGRYENQEEASKAYNEKLKSLNTCGI